MGTRIPKNAILVMMLALLFVSPSSAVMRFMDSFDHLATAQMVDKWSTSSGSITNSPVRTGTGAYAGGQNCISLDPQGTWIVGGAFNWTGVFEDLVYYQFGGSSLRMVVRAISTNNAIRVDGPGGGPTVGQSANNTLQIATWNYLEFKRIGGVSFEARVNGTSVLSFSDTENALVVDTLCINGGTWDDVYMEDGTGTVNNDFLGPVRVKMLQPNANSSVTWTPSTGTNFSNVNSVPAGSAFNSSSTVGQTDLFTIPALLGAGPLAYQINLRVQEDASGIRSVATVLSSGATTSVGPDFFLPTTFTQTRTVGDVDPNTSAPFTLSNWNAALWGIRLTN